MTISSRFLLPASLGLGLLVWACGSDDLPPSQTGDGDGDGDVGDGDGDVGDGDGDGDGDVGDGDGDGDASGGTAGDGDGDGSGGTTGDGDGDVTPQVDPAGESCALGTNYYLGEMRILNNQWTSHQDDQCIFINEDRSFGWTWDNAGGFTPLPTSQADYPNYPEVEFGINPWGREQDEWEIGTSSTTLLPIRLSDLTQASMTIDVESTTDGGGSWNLAFELWLSPVDPTTQMTSPSAELMVFFGNDPSYYPEPDDPDYDGSSTVGDYTLAFSSDVWADGYRYRQWRRSGSSGNSTSFNGTLDIKALLDVSGFDENHYITRFEIGNEVYAGSAGNTKINSLSFSVNGESRSAM